MHTLIAAIQAGAVEAAQSEIADFLEAHLALQHRLGFDGTAGWKHRSVYDLVTVHGRWSTSASLPAEVRQRSEREHPRLAHTEGFAQRLVDPTWVCLMASRSWSVRGHDERSQHAFMPSNVAYAFGLLWYHL
ncbi:MULTISPECIES: hypothetical protein [unclassified Streptomyces]|uniref:hypothetical protein n=1 Tax=unclassified Streptomyces TaxID=2593676 RepID=UPI0037F99E61